MHKIYQPILILLIIGLFLTSCSKDLDTTQMRSDFSVKVEGTKWSTSFMEAKISQGLMKLNFTDGESIETGRTMNLIINGSEIGAYHQHYDHRTGVSTTQCRMVCKTVDQVAGVPATYVSYEGKVNISDLDFENKIISGRFWFKLRSANSSQLEIKEGVFTNLRFE